MTNLSKFFGSLESLKLFIIFFLSLHGFQYDQSPFLSTLFLSKKGLIQVFRSFFNFRIKVEEGDTLFGYDKPMTTVESSVTPKVTGRRKPTETVLIKDRNGLSCGRPTIFLFSSLLVLGCGNFIFISMFVLYGR